MSEARQPPKSWRACPKCYGRATKIVSLNTGELECQQCDHRYASPEIWTGQCSLYWRTDEFGHEDCALYVGGLHVGSLMYVPKLHGPDRGSVQRVNERPWRAWIMIDGDGELAGWYVTQQEAKDALMDRAVKEILQ